MKHLINLAIGTIVFVFVVFFASAFAAAIGSGVCGEGYIVSAIATLCAIVVVSSRNVIHAIQDTNNTQKSEEQ